MPTEQITARRKYKSSLKELKFTWFSEKSTEYIRIKEKDTHREKKKEREKQKKMPTTNKSEEKKP